MAVDADKWRKYWVIAFYYIEIGFVRPEIQVIFLNGLRLFSFET